MKRCFTPLLKSLNWKFKKLELGSFYSIFLAVLGIRMFLGLPDPDPLVRGMDPDPSIFLKRCWGDWNIACNIKF